VDVVVCGNEVVSAVSPISSSLIVAQRGDSKTILQSDYETYFATSFNAMDSHEDCTALAYYYHQGVDCQGTFSPIASDIPVDTSQFGTFKLCIKAQTLGKQEVTQIISLEVCGNEEISIEPANNPSVNSGPHSLMQSKPDNSFLVNVNYKFLSSSQNCVVNSFKLVK
jgi:hypothetical protein